MKLRRAMDLPGTRVLVETATNPNYLREVALAAFDEIERLRAVLADTAGDE